MMGRGHPTGRTPKYTTELEVLLQAKNDRIEELKAENKKYSAGMQENCQLRKRIEELKRSLDLHITDLALAEIKIEELKAEKADLIKNGWRSCIDHIIKPEDTCPVCKLARVEALADSWRDCANNIGILEDVDNYSGILNCADELSKALEKDEWRNHRE